MALRYRCQQVRRRPFWFFFFFLVLGSVPPRGDFLASQQGSLTKVIFFFVGCRAGNKLTGQTSDKRTPTRWRCQPADSGDAPMAGGGRHGRRGEQANNIRVQVFALVKQPKNNIGTFKGRKIKIFLWGPKKGANGWRQLTHNSLCSWAHVWRWLDALITSNWKTLFFFLHWTLRRRHLAIFTLLTQRLARSLTKSFKFLRLLNAWHLLLWF